ncbi:NUDIX hydrolase [Cumulibacter manganitolerans]|uniref:NUDIX hydrolase n=1 Tax=Cumulibacter manganitolerans TaxID=1884992 RepID=UPI0018860D69|nr:NUDIX domain-containing protein [Cumulibacter manganitolerans]
MSAAPPTRCAGCGRELYVNASPAVGTVLVRDGSFLAIKRAREPWRGYWDIPGGFCDSGEHPEEAAVREIREETGIDVQIVGLAGIYLDVYPFQGDVISILNLYYAATAPEDAEPRLVDAEASEVAWLPISDHPPLAFEHEEQALADAVRLLSRSAGQPDTLSGGGFTRSSQRLLFLAALRVPR